MFAIRGTGTPSTQALLVADLIQIGYKRLRLDTVEAVMRDAVGLYRKLGFREIASYRENPIDGALYMERTL